MTRYWWTTFGIPPQRVTNPVDIDPTEDGIRNLIDRLKAQTFRSFVLLGFDVEKVSEGGKSFDFWSKESKIPWEFPPTLATQKGPYAKFLTLATPYGYTAIIDCARLKHQIWDILLKFLNHQKTMLCGFAAFDDLWSLTMTFGPRSQQYEKEESKGSTKNAKERLKGQREKFFPIMQLRVLDLHVIMECHDLQYFNGLYHLTPLASMGCIPEGRTLKHLAQAFLGVDLFKVGEFRECKDRDKSMYFNTNNPRTTDVQYMAWDAYATVNCIMVLYRFGMIPHLEVFLKGFPHDQRDPESIPQTLEFLRNAKDHTDPTYFPVSGYMETRLRKLFDLRSETLFPANVMTMPGYVSTAEMSIRATTAYEYSGILPCIPKKSRRDSEMDNVFFTDLDVYGQQAYEASPSAVKDYEEWAMTSPPPFCVPDERDPRIILMPFNPVFYAQVTEQKETMCTDPPKTDVIFYNQPRSQEEIKCYLRQCEKALQQANDDFVGLSKKARTKMSSQDHDSAKSIAKIITNLRNRNMIGYDDKPTEEFVEYIKETLPEKALENEPRNWFGTMDPDTSILMGFSIPSLVNIGDGLTIHPQYTTDPNFAFREGDTPHKPSSHDILPDQEIKFPTHVELETFVKRQELTDEEWNSVTSQIKRIKKVTPSSRLTNSKLERIKKWREHCFGSLGKKVLEEWETTDERQVHTGSEPSTETMRRSAETTEERSAQQLSTSTILTAPSTADEPMETTQASESQTLGQLFQQQEKVTGKPKKRTSEEMRAEEVKKGKIAKTQNPQSEGIEQISPGSSQGVSATSVPATPISEIQKLRAQLAEKEKEIRETKAKLAKLEQAPARTSGIQNQSVAESSRLELSQLSIRSEIESSDNDGDQQMETFEDSVIAVTEERELSTGFDVPKTASHEDIAMVPIDLPNPPEKNLRMWEMDFTNPQVQDYLKRGRPRLLFEEVRAAYKTIVEKTNLQRRKNDQLYRARLAII